MLDACRSFFLRLQNYCGGWMVWCAFALAFIFLCLLKRKTKKTAFILFGISAIIIMYNPLVMVLWGKLIQTHLYWRMFWLAPAVCLFAYTLTLLLERAKAWRCLLAAVLLILVFAAAGRNVYLNGGFTRADNPYKIPQTTKEICDYMLEQEGETKALVSSGLYCYIRQYTSKIKLLYGRDIEGYTTPVTNARIKKIYRKMAEDPLDVSYLFRAARKRGCHFIVLSKEKSLDDDPEKFGYRMAVEIGMYRVYQIKEE